MKLVGLAQHGISINDVDRVEYRPLAQLDIQEVDTSIRKKSTSKTQDEEYEISPSSYDALFDQHLREQGGSSSNLLQSK
jgi:hypothetical protein